MVAFLCHLASSSYQPHHEDVEAVGVCGVVVDLHGHLGRIINEQRAIHRLDHLHRRRWMGSIIDRISGCALSAMGEQRYPSAKRKIQTRYYDDEQYQYQSQYQSQHVQSIAACPTQAKDRRQCPTTDIHQAKDVGENVEQNWVWI